MTTTRVQASGSTPQTPTSQAPKPPKGKEYKIKSGDSLWKIVKNEYGVTSNKDIAAKVQELAKANGIKNPNLIFAGKTLTLTDNLKLNDITVDNPASGKTTTFKGEGDSYYRENGIMGDIATKPDQYPGQPKMASKLNQTTQATAEVETVTADVTPYFTSKTARDLKAFDIAAKPAGVGGFTDMNAKGKGTDAYKMFLEVNADDFTAKETEYKGKKETNHYLDTSKSDGKITLFSSEIRKGKEYLAIKGTDDKIHYYDKSDGLKEVQID